MRKIFKPWVLVTIGILFNVASAVVTHYFIGLNNQKIENLNYQINNFETLIDSQWRTKTELDRSQEFLLILQTLSQQTAPEQSLNITNLIQTQLANITKQQNLDPPISKDNPFINYDTIIETIELAHEKIINSINDTYLDKLTIENKQSPLKQKNALLFSIAIFLQVTGLILVLARDIKT